MPRIPLVTAASMTDAQRRVYDAMMSGPRRSPPVGPLAAAMHRPDLAEKWSELGLVLRFNSSFEPRLREFVILLTGRYWDCQFEHQYLLLALAIAYATRWGTEETG